MELHVSLPAEFEICVLWSSLPTPSHSVFLFRLATLALTTCPLERSLKNDTTCRSSSQHRPEGLPGSSASLGCSFSTPASSSSQIPPRRLRVASLNPLPRSWSKVTTVHASRLRPRCPLELLGTSNERAKSHALPCTVTFPCNVCISAKQDFGHVSFTGQAIFLNGARRAASTERRVWPVMLS